MYKVFGGLGKNDFEHIISILNKEIRIYTYLDSNSVIKIFGVWQALSLNPNSKELVMA